MPDTDGYALMREMRAHEAAYGGCAPATAPLAYAHAEGSAHAFAAGFHCQLAKHTEPPALVNAVAALPRPSED